jgi:uncharacterized protein (TIGR02646 family)
MRKIVKGKEPTSLTEHRATLHTNYDNYPGKETLREFLIKEQRGICCYCLSRIPTKLGKMKIEHWHSQANFPIEQLDYSNMLGACMGNEGQPGSDQHCDTYKGEKNLTLNPANPLHSIEDRIHFLSDGKISSPDATIDAELNAVLNLNVAHLKNNRKAVLDSFKKFLGKRKLLSQSQWGNLLREWNGESSTGDLRPFCQVIVYWIRKRLAGYGSSVSSSPNVPQS